MFFSLSRGNFEMVEKIFNLFIETLQLTGKASTASQYYTLGSNHILNKFNSRCMDNVSEEELISHIAAEKDNNLSRHEKRLSPKTIYDITTLINSLWAFAYEKGHVKKRIKISTPKIIKRKVQVFIANEIRAIENHIIRNITPHAIAILLCLYTGLRIGEVCALQWKDIDLKLKLINVHKTVIRIKNLDNNSKTKTKVIIDAPKSTASIRLIPIPKILIPLLKAAKEKDDYYVATGSIFFMEPRLLQKRYKTLLKLAKVQYQNFHTLRHTFATNAYNNGMSIKILSEILGHADVKTTLNLYVHTSMEQKQKEMNSIYKTSLAL